MSAQEERPGQFPFMDAWSPRVNLTMIDPQVGSRSFYSVLTNYGGSFSCLMGVLIF